MAGILSNVFSKGGDFFQFLFSVPPLGFEGRERGKEKAIVHLELVDSQKHFLW